jgi:hypothetical protein
MLPSNQFTLKFNTTRLESVHELAHTDNENGHIALAIYTKDQDCLMRRYVKRWWKVKL